MKKQFFTALCAMAMLLPTQAKDYKYDTVKGDLMKSRIYTLDNGLKVYLAVNKEQPRIFANIAVRTGSRNGKRLHDDVLHISKKPLRGELSGFLSIYQAEASCIFPAACLAARLPPC